MLALSKYGAFCCHFGYGGEIKIWCIFAAILDMAVKYLREASVNYTGCILYVKWRKFVRHTFPPEMQR